MRLWDTRTGEEITGRVVPFDVKAAESKGYVIGVDRDAGKVTVSASPFAPLFERLAQIHMNKKTKPKPRPRPKY